MRGRLAGWVLALLLPAWTAAASLPFVDDSGLVRMELRYGDVVKQLGESPVSRIEHDPDEARAAGDHVFEYPAQGLVFTIRSAERGTLDPRVASMRATRPEAGATLHGLVVGQPEAEARVLLGRHYRLLRNEAGVVAGGHLEGASRRVVVAEFRGGRVSALAFDTSEPPQPPSRVWLGVKRAFGVVLWFGFLLALGVGGWLLHRVFERRVVGPPQGGSPVLHTLAGLMALASLGLGAVGLQLMREGSYAALLGLMLLGGGAFGLFLTLLVLRRSRHPGVSKAAGALLMAVVVLIVLASVLPKLLR